MALPLTYSLRNLTRRPGRTLLTILGIGIIVFAGVLMAALARGIEARLIGTGEEANLLVISRKGENIIFSAIEPDELVHLNQLQGLASTPDGRSPLVSPELMDFAPTHVSANGVTVSSQINVRGVLPIAYHVHTSLNIYEGQLPQTPEEVLVGSAAHVRLGLPVDALAPGKTLRLYGKEWKICGRFNARGSLFESEVWVNGEELQTSLRRQSYTFAVVRMESPEAVRAALPLFHTSGALEKYFKGWQEPTYYREYLESMSWVYWLAVLMVAAVTLAGILIGINTMYTAILNRIREIATQRVLGFDRLEILRGLLLESLLVSLIAGALGVAAGYFLNDIQFKFAQGVFRLLVDPVVMSAAMLQALLIGLIGALIPCYKGLRLTIVQALRYGRDA